MRRAVSAVAGVGGGAAFLVGVLAAGDAPPPTALVAAEIARTGVTNPVTAVLLDFRAYDTLLELAVVLFAAVAGVALAPAALGPPPLAGPVAAAAARLLSPALIVFGAYVLWIGAEAPGGAFQAAALLAGGAILLETVGAGPRLAGAGGGDEAGRALAFATLGVAVFAAAGAAAAALGRAPLDWPDAQAGAVILVVEVAATAGLTVALTTLYRLGTFAGTFGR